MTSFFVSVGSNIDPEKNVPACIELLKQGFRVANMSSIYETNPVGPAGDFKFWNFVVELDFGLSKVELEKKLKTIEDALGRKRDPQNKFSPRTIDLDIIGSDGWQDAPFIVIPFAEIAPDHIDKISGKKLRDLADACGPYGTQIKNTKYFA
ncbi:MAG: 2-amino-4-hydroxy-6-hydroxymethyldihydropteridine diphosphokinase [Candidatus Omnitrophota bacterium]|nr:2-amino-4-hydroxy-6-hydroxymethyldihydropteridine diphosphokinase [Candidatus Omnitrophota bacterium]